MPDTSTRPSDRVRPNILLITSDQHRADAMGVAGHPVVQTPHLDQLAFEGVRFTRTYSDCPVCIPSRTTIITGRQAHLNGIPAYNDQGRITRDREDFVGSLVTAAGYQTQLVGKTHWHTPLSFRAGFEGVTWPALMRKAQVEHSGNTMARPGIGFNEYATTLSTIPPELQLTGWTVERAVEFIQLRELGQPFFLWVSIQDPHPPFTIHEPYYSMYDDAPISDPVTSQWSVHSEECPRSHFLQRMAMKTHRLSSHQLRKSRSVYYGMITNIDHQIGRLLGTMAYLGDLENTVIIYASDHGEFLGDHAAGKKSSFCEAAARVPFIVRFPKSWKEDPSIGPLMGTDCDSLIELADLLPTICDIAGARIPEDVTGRSILPLITGDWKPKEYVHGQIDRSHMYRDGSYKYLYFADDGSEMLFAADDENDEHPLAQRGPFGAKGDLSLLDAYRRRFTDHLREENHADYDSAADAPVNEALPKPSEREALAKDQSGLVAAGWGEFQMRGLQGLN